MKRAIIATRKSRGRPRVDATQIGLRVPPDQLEQLDAYIARQPDPKPSRPEAIRQILAAHLKRTARSSRSIEVQDLTSQNDT